VSDPIYLSIVIPIRNEQEHICKTLEALVGQDYPRTRYELLVVDGRSTDDTRELVSDFIRRHPEVNIHLLDNPGRLSSRARNIGIRAARGQLTGVIDGHVHVPNDKLFANMERLKEENGALCLARPAPLLTPPGKKGAAFWIAMARRSWLAHSRNSYIYSGHQGFVDPVSSGFAYDRSVFDRVGYFDETFDAAEDVEFHYRLKEAGIEAYASPDLTINSYSRESYRALFRQMTRYGIGRARLLRKHPQAFTKETLIPPAIFLFFACLPAAAGSCLWLPWATLVYVLGLTAYFAILCGSGLVAVQSGSRPIHGLAVAFAIWTTHMGLGWGFIRAAFSPVHLLPNRARHDDGLGSVAPPRKTARA
jgi:glycosyltransferase involved in cell wall biosynthesis